MVVESLEAIRQTGPLQESNGSWVERLMGDAVRVVKNRFNIF